MALKKICGHLFFLSFFLAPLVAHSQYYYKDVLNTSDINKEFSILKKQNFKTIKLKSFEDNDEPSEGFFCEKKINKDYSQSEMISRSYITGESLLKTNYNFLGQITKAVTTTPTATNTVQYDYDTIGNLIKITTLTFGDYDSTQIEETHQYLYTSDNKPEKMVRKKNNQILSTITFKTDKNGNVIEEDASGKGGDKKYYYYYDTENRMTDVVHYNDAAARLLPDLVFEYDQSRQPKQMLSIDESARNYFIWRYAYNANKLPEIQKCYSKEKRLLGTIEYEYQ